MPVMPLALLLLWGQLLISGQLQPVVAIALPGLLLLQRKPNWLAAQGRLRLLTLTLIGAWLVSTPLADRTTWLHSLANLLWLMAALKLLESRTVGSKRRAGLVLLIGLGLAGVLSQSLAASLVQGSCALLVVTGLLGLEAGREPLKDLLRRSLALLAVLLPVVLVAFLLLPRLPALWSLPGGGVGRSGLSDELKPGELASLVQSDALAARVDFTSAPPPPEQRYWRVLVHQLFDGRGWSSASPPVLLDQPAGVSGPALERWLVEPTSLPWRPWGGEGLAGADSGLSLSSTGGQWAKPGGSERQLYAIHADPSGALWRQVPPTDLDLALPRGSNPKLEALGASWNTADTTAQDRVQRAQAWFLKQGFRYSLSPGRLPQAAPLDAFLFQQKIGFCEHYAASFAALMRAAGVPARVVVGYQGGRWQTPLTGPPYLRIEQRDAHAWSEVWINGQGWVDVDPTSWIAPARIRQSLAVSLNSAERRQLSQAEAPNWVKTLADQWQGLDTRWQVWVMQFDANRQRDLLPRWLQGRWQGLAAVIGLALTLGAALGLLLVIDAAGQQGDPLRQALNRCLQPLARLGHEPKPGETLLQFCERASTLEPAIADSLAALNETYSQARFGDLGSVDTKALKPIRKEIWRYVRKRRT